MSVTYYDKNGNRTGTSSKDDGGGIVFLTAIFLVPYTLFINFLVGHQQQ